MLNIDKLKVIKKFTGNGHCKAVNLLEGDIVKKYYNNSSVFDRELSALQLLQDFSFIPRLIDHDRDNLIIYMSYCGHQLNITDFIKYSDKIDKMSKKIQKMNIYHNDIKPRNICIRKGKLYLIDFSLAMKDSYFRKSNGEIKLGLNKVKHYLERYNIPY